MYVFFGIEGWSPQPNLQALIRENLRILLNVACLVLLTVVLVHVIQSHEQELMSTKVPMEWSSESCVFKKPGAMLPHQIK